MDQRDVNKLIRLAKKLVPKFLRWWKKRQSQQQQQQQHQSSQGPSSGYGGPPQSGQWYNGPPQGSGPPSGGQPGWQQAPQQHHGGCGGHQFTSALPSGGKINSDMMHASDPRYVDLRNRAIQEGNLMHQCFDKASKAHDQGDGARAKQFSNEGHQHQAERDRLNAEASQFIYAQNNQGNSPDTVDLHGLFVEEAVDRVEQAVQDGQRAGRSRLVVITGKGLHSTQHVAKIKPRIEQLMVQYGLEAHVDPHNTGRLIVNLSRGSGGSRDVGALVNQLDTGAGQDQCTIM